MTRLALFLMWLLHGLPLPLLAACGRGLGRLLFVFGRERRRVALTNLGLCFPHLDAAAKLTRNALRADRDSSRSIDRGWPEVGDAALALARQHFEYFGRSFLERGWLWWAAPERIRRRVKIEHAERLDALKGRPLILLVPHFVGLDAAWTRLSMEIDMSGFYANQKNPVFNEALRRGRARFGKPLMLSRQEGALRGVRAIRSGYPFFYLPDMDYGPRDAIFVPFFGVPAATITGLSRLARLTGATVLPVVARMTATGYVIEIGEAWQGFPGTDVEADTRRMNAFIEQEVLKMPAQYFWLHKRFKTRPRGENGVY